MQLRKERTHNCGLSNVDFRRLNDQPNIKKFQDDMRATQFAYMGRTGIAYNFEHCGFGKPETLLVNSGFKIAEPPNPRATTASEYYAKRKKPFRKPASVQKKRTKQLEDNLWNERVFTGEDVPGLTWYNNNVLDPEEAAVRGIRGSKSPKAGANKPNMLNMPHMKGDKLEKHERALQETQLVKVKNKETLEGKVDIQKVKEIRRALRRRYGNRSNYHKIFNSWDRHHKGYIDTTDLHCMVNRLGIKINSQESQVLMASHDHNGNKKLTLEEFMDLIFSTNDNMNVDLSKIRFSANVVEIEPNEDIMQGIRNDAAKLKKIKEESQFKYVLQKSIKEMFKDFSEQDQAHNHELTLETFMHVIKEKTSLPSHMKENMELIQDFFNDFDVNKTGKVDYYRMLENIKAFRYLGDTDINVDLGPATEEPVQPSARGQTSPKPEQRPIVVRDVQKVPENQLQQIIERTLRVSRMLQAKYGSQDKFEKELKEKLVFDSYGNVSETDLERHLIEICKENLVRREISRKDLEGFLSSLVYNKYKLTNGNAIAPYIFSDDIQISNKAYAVQRPQPPPALIAENFNRAAQTYTDGFKIAGATEKSALLPEVPLKRFREMVQELQDKTFADKKYLYQIFKEYDRDCDGYVSYADMKEQVKRMNVSANDAELKKFIDMIDTKKQGYLDFTAFSTSITKGMVDRLAPLPDDEETYLYRRTRPNLVPNGEKARENLLYHRTFTEKFNEIRNRFVPDRNLLHSAKPSTRFGATPTYLNTFPNFQAPQTSATHMKEEERLGGAGELNAKVAYQKTEKQVAEARYLAKLARIQNHQKSTLDAINERSLKKGIEDKQQVQNRLAKFQAYEAKTHTVTM